MPTQRVVILAASLGLLVSCSRPTPKPTAGASRWVLLSAPHLMNKDEGGEPCTGQPYVRAPFSDWENLGEYNSFQECAAAMWAPKSDPNPELHQKGKLSAAELMLGFRCVQATDARLSSPPPYNWEAETTADH